VAARRMVLKNCILIFVVWFFLVGEVVGRIVAMKERVFYQVGRSD